MPKDRSTTQPANSGENVRPPLPINPLIACNGVEADDNATVAARAAAVVSVFTGMLCKEDPFEFLGNEDSQFGMYLALDCARDAMKYLADGGRPD